MVKDRLFKLEKPLMVEYIVSWKVKSLSPKKDWKEKKKIQNFASLWKANQSFLFCLFFCLTVCRVCSIVQNKYFSPTWFVSQGFVQLYSKMSSVYVEQTAAKIRKILIYKKIYRRQIFIYKKIYRRQIFI